jgi:hypothetical protein
VSRITGQSARRAPVHPRLLSPMQQSGHCVCTWPSFHPAPLSPAQWRLPAIYSTTVQCGPACVRPKALYSTPTSPVSSCACTSAPNPRVECNAGLLSPTANICLHQSSNRPCSLVVAMRGAAVRKGHEQRDLAQESIYLSTLPRFHAIAKLRIAVRLHLTHVPRLSSRGPEFHVFAMRAETSPMAQGWHSTATCRRSATSQTAEIVLPALSAPHDNTQGCECHRLQCSYRSPSRRAP